jgi:putative heme transporter
MRTYPLYVKAVYLLLLGFLLFNGLVYAKFILIPLVLGCLFAILLTPVGNLFEKWGMHRTLSSFLCILIIILIAAFLVFLVSKQIISFIDNLPLITAKINSRLNDIQAFIERKTHLTPTKQISWLQKEISESTSLFTPALSATTSTIATIALVPLYTFFLLFYRNKILIFFEKVTPEQEHYTVHQIIQRVQELVQSYLSGVIIVVFIVAIIISAGLEIIGVPYAIFLGALAGLLNVIPYLGILSAATLSVILATITSDSASTPLFVFFLFLGTHLMEANIITPNIVGSKVSINPLASLLALVLGEEVWGIAGMILFIPMLGIVKVIFDNVKDLQAYGFLLGMDGEGSSVSWHGTWLRTRRIVVRWFKR